MRSKVGNMAGKASSFLLIVVIIATIFSFLVPFSGWRVDTVLSGSMEPQFSAGDIVITGPVDVNEINTGDIITFRSSPDGRLTTHRVASIEKGELLGFQTKGDANEGLDPFVVPETDIVGRVCFHVPYFGHVSHFVRTPIGFVLMSVFPGSIIAAEELVNILQLLRKEES